MPIVVKSRDEIAIMREAGRHVAEVLQILVDALRPGLVEKELDDIVRKEFKKRRVIPTFLGYAHPPYPATLCVSPNDVIVHGIPGKREVAEGDVISIDLGCTHFIIEFFGRDTKEPAKLFAETVLPHFR